MTISYQSRCLLSQKYPFDIHVFSPCAVGVYKASRLLTPPPGRGKHNSHSGMKENTDVRPFFFYDVKKVEHVPKMNKLINT